MRFVCSLVFAQSMLLCSSLLFPRRSFAQARGRRRREKKLWRCCSERQAFNKKMWKRAILSRRKIPTVQVSMTELPGHRMDGKPADMLRFLKRVVGRKTKSFFRLQQSDFFFKKKKSRIVKVRKAEGKGRRSGGGGERVRSGTEGGRGGGGR